MGKCKDCKHYIWVGDSLDWQSLCEHPAGQAWYADNETRVFREFPWCGKFETRERRYRFRKPLILQEEKCGVHEIRIGKDQVLRLHTSEVEELLEEVDD